MFNLQEYINDLEPLVNIDSGSYEVDGVNQVASFFAERFQSLGWLIDRVSLSEAVGELLDMRSNASERYDVLLIGHMDTIFPKGEPQRRPFRQDGRFAYGPGAADMKCGVLAIWYALKDLPEQAKGLSIRVIMNPDEEIHSKYSTPYIIRASAQAEHVFVMEPAMADGAFCIERKGWLGYQFRFTGISTHAGYRFDRENASAIDEMAHWIIALNRLSDRERGTTVNVGKVSGGTAENVVAEHALMGVEFRIWEKSEAERIKLAVRDLLAHPFIEGVKVEETGHFEKPVLLPSAQTVAFLERMRRIYAKRDVPFACKRCGGVSDANVAAAYAPIVVDRIGPWGDFNHSEKEYMRLDSVENAVELLKDIIEDIAIHATPDGQSEAENVN